MRTLPGATTLSRVLIGLDRSEASGALSVTGADGACRIVVERGRVVGGRIAESEWVDQEEARAALCRVADWQGLTLRFADGKVEPVRLMPEPVPASALSMQLMRWAVGRFDVGALRVELGRETYRLTEAGETLVEGLCLRPEERAVVFWLRRGVAAEELILLPGCGIRGYRFLATLKLVRAASPRVGTSYPLMLRKRREVRGHAPPHELLDLPREAGGRDARKALRRLVRDLHPDRFGGAAPGLRRASGEIVTALVAAEARITTARDERDD